MFYEAKICSTMHIVLLLHSTNMTYNYDASHALILLHYIHIFSDIISSFKLPYELGKENLPLILKMSK